MSDVVLSNILVGLIFLSIFVGLGWLAWKVDRHGIVRMRAKRDRDIETAMRIAMNDAEAQQRIGRKIMREYER